MSTSISAEDGISGETGSQQQFQQLSTPADRALTEELPSATPRDARVLHLMLASQGISRYHDRVPLQLMDFAYRYTSSVLEDALLYADHSRSTAPSASTAANTVLSVEDVRLAVSARLNYQFKPAPPKEMLLELAQERNRRPLPPVPLTSAHGSSIRLPPEKYCLTAKDWDIDEELREMPSDTPEPEESVAKRIRSG
ncbi:transcription initiation factor IID, 31kD subunit-domain-containing protein [Lipomyces oligophaga]|uniref:transcription initiation factor IID, 31kD subunit-domain-containing protein n=1 Tax=Lipomyces oligophaga TaxID=45792 RepID=UPI0034CF7988